MRKYINISEIFSYSSTVFVLFVCLFLLPHQTHASLVSNTTPNTLKSGLVGWWTMDGKDTNWATNKTNDLSGNGNTGTLTNMSTSTSPAPGKVGQGLSFDGVNDYINAGSGASLNLTSNFTLSVWVKPSSNGYIIAKKEDSKKGLNLYSNLTSGYFQFFDGGNSAVALLDVTATPNVWQHIVLVFGSGTSMTPYKNGVAKTMKTSFTALQDNPAQNLYFGARNGPTSLFTGSIDDVRIYSRALSSTEIRQLYSMGAATKQAVSPKVGPTACTTGLSCGLVGYWTMDGKDIVNGVAQDKSGNGRSGNLISIATTTFYAKGVIGQGFNFDGADDRVTTASDSVGTGVVTVSAWVKARSLGGASSGRIIDNTKAMFTATSSNRVAFTSDGGTTVAFSASNAIPFNTWKFVTVTRDAVGVANIYVNGVLSGTANQSSGSPAAGAGVQLGNNSSASATFDGLIDDVRIYNRALSATEIRQLYDMGATKQAVSPKVGPTACTTGLSCGLVGYWTFDGKDTSWATNKTNDLSGNGNTGTMTSMSTTTSPVRGKVGQGLRFDGADDRVNLGTPASLSFASGTPWTVSSWVNSPPTSGYLSYMGGGNSIFKLTAGTGLINFYFYSNNYTNYSFGSSAAYVGKSKWFYLTWVSDNLSNISLYINGVYSTTVNVVNSKLDFQSIGSSGTSNYAKVQLDDVRIYSRALSITEIKQLYNIGR